MSTVMVRRRPEAPRVAHVSRRLAAFGAVVALTVAAGACSPPASDSGTAPASTIKMAGLFDLTGGDAAAGTAVAQATRYAVKQVNDAGGIQGHKIELIDLDDASDPAKAVLQYRKAV